MNKLFCFLVLNIISYSVKAQDVTLPVHQPPPLQITTGSTIFNILLGRNMVLGTDVTISGGTLPYHTSWSSSGLEEDYIGDFFYIMPDDTTFYTLKVIDANNCIKEQLFKVNVIFPISLALSSNQITCFGKRNGSISLNISGGAEPYTISWDDGNADIMRSNLGSGDYHVLVTDALGQHKDTSITLLESSQIQVSLNESICDGNTFHFNGIDLTETGSYSAIFQTQGGCDSIVSLDLTVYPSYSKNIETTICQGETFSFAGQELDHNGQYINNLRTISDCDSIIILNLRINPIYLPVFVVEICQNETYSFAGKELTESGIYQDSLKTISGCDSIITLNFTINPVSVQTIEASICQGETYFFGGNRLIESGQYQESLKSIAGCDSITILNLVVNPVSIQTIEVSICQGESYLFAGTELTESGQYLDSLKMSTYCDSIFVLNLTVDSLPVIPVITQNVNRLTSSSSEGNQWFKDGSKIPDAIYPTLDIIESGDYDVIVTSISGCSSQSVSYHAAYTAIPLIHTTDLTCNIFPNPNNGLFTVEIETDKAEIIVLKLVSGEGKTIANQQFKRDAGRHYIQFGKENLAKGVYMLQARIGKKISRQKLVVD